MTYSDEEILSHVDHTLLKPTATWEQIKKLCGEALEYKTASVCIPPTYIARVQANFPGLNICTVIGFPNGYNTLETKIAETENAISVGADEIDMVINLTDVKNQNWGAILTEIKALKRVCGPRVLKVIIETAYLDEDEKIKMCEIVTESGADYIKTSTGFASSGATFEDIELFSKHIGSNVKMKAAGGISSYDDMVKFLDLGCERLGTSSGVRYVTER
jgi:deoxyribose-phosphate aldolase